MKRLLLAILVFMLSPSTEAGVYNYPLYREGIEVRCKDGKPSHLIEIKAGRGIKLSDYGEDQYAWPIIYLYPEAPNKQYRYFPSTAGTQCSYRKLTQEEKAALIGQTFTVCLGDELVTRKHDCYGWN